MVKMRGEGATGNCAIWTGGEDNAPLNDPMNNLHRLKYHSALDYPKVISEWADNVTFAARTEWMPSLSGGSGAWGTTETTRVVTHTLFAHGRGGQPWVLGSIKIGGIDVAFTGSVPVQQGVLSNASNGAAAGDGKHPWARWVTLGADATHVRLFEYCPVGRWASGPNAHISGIYMPQIVLPVTVWVTDEILA